jgi:hypothetical protein
MMCCHQEVAMNRLPDILTLDLPTPKSRDELSHGVQGNGCSPGETFFLPPDTCVQRVDAVGGVLLHSHHLLRGATFQSQGALPDIFRLSGNVWIPCLPS